MIRMQTIDGKLFTVFGAMLHGTGAADRNTCLIIERESDSRRAVITISELLGIVEQWMEIK